MVVVPSPEEVEAAKTPRGFWKRATLARWGVPWPPPAGWRKRLEAEWRKANDLEDPAEARERRRRALARHRLTELDYAKLLVAQGGRCGICEELGGSQRFEIDHDHRCCPRKYSCGRCIRGLLCSSCNAFIQNRDDPVMLRAAADYLTRAAFRGRSEPLATRRP